MRIGNQLKALRSERGISAEELAKNIGISASAIGMYENGYRIPRDQIKIRIAEFYDVTVESIFFPVE
ncbi:MAG: helix-turn-helix transcriptional regulator [Clostridiales bacterium]|nr:helix-turn-helix transcriptional regulator [Clostridiales bacterium]